MDAERVPMDISSIIVGQGPIASLVVLKPHAGHVPEAAPRIQKAACESRVDATSAGQPHAGEGAPSTECASPLPLDALPIRMGAVEATAIGMGVNDVGHRQRPMTHDLLLSLVKSLGGIVRSVEIERVEGTVFYARIDVESSTGCMSSVDARPSDALAIAVRTGVPIYASSAVIRTAGCPDFGAVKKDEQEREMAGFHDFVEHLSPEDFD